jgi:hypothetical protein
MGHGVSRKKDDNVASVEIMRGRQDHAAIVVIVSSYPWNEQTRSLLPLSTALPDSN